MCVCAWSAVQAESVTPFLRTPQSAGILLLAEVAAVVGGRPLAEHLRAELFGPLGMADSSLGVARARQRSREVTMHFKKVAAEKEWDHNSEWWRNLGAPWGGLLTTVTDLTLFYQALLAGGTGPDGRRVLREATVAAATTSQTRGPAGLSSLPAARLETIYNGLGPPPPLSPSSRRRRSCPP